MSDPGLTYKAYPCDEDTVHQLKVLRFIYKHYPDNAKYQGATDHMSLTYRSNNFLSHCSDMGLAEKYLCRALPAMMAPGLVYRQLLDIRQHLRDREDWAEALRGLNEICETQNVQYRRHLNWVKLTIDDVSKGMPGMPIHSVVWEYYNRMVERQCGLAPEHSSPKLLRSYLENALDNHPFTCQASSYAKMTSDDPSKTKDPSFAYIQAVCGILKSTATSKERHQEQHN